MADKNDKFRSYTSAIIKEISLKTPEVLGSLTEEFKSARMISEMESVTFQRIGGQSGASQLITAIHQHVKGDEGEKTYRISRALKILDEQIPNTVKKIREG